MLSGRENIWHQLNILFCADQILVFKVALWFFVFIGLFVLMFCV